VKLKVGIVGLGMGRDWAKAFALHPKCEMVAVCDLAEEKAKTVAKEVGAKKAFTDYENLLELDLDIVAVVTPGPLHVKQAVAAMGYGKHVLSAVPTAWTLDECEQLIKTVKRTGMKYMLGESMCYHPAITFVKEMYDAGETGEIFFYQGSYFHDLGGPDSAHDLYSKEARPNGLHPGKKYTWRYGFPPFNYLEHNSAPIIWVLGQRMTEVTAYGWGYDPEGFEEKYSARWSAPYTNPYTFEAGLFRMEGGAVAKISICWVLGGQWFETQYFGTKQSYVCAFAPWGKDILMKKDFRPFRIPMIPFDRPNYRERLDPALRSLAGAEDSAFLVQEFAESVLNDTTPPIDVYKAVSFTAPGICAHQSALEHRTIKIPDFGKGAK